MVWLLHFKLVAMFSIFFTTICAGGFPLIRRRSGDKPVSKVCWDGFSAGVLLGVGLIHMLPDAVSLFARQGAGILVPMLISASTVLVLLMFTSLNKSCKKVPSKKRSFAIVASAILVLHAFLEGTALGIAKADSLVLIIFLAIIAHKATESIAFVSYINQCDFSTINKLLALILFAVMSPLGIAIGSSSSNLLLVNTPLIEPVLLSLSAGVLFYLGLFHGNIRLKQLEIISDVRHYSSALLGFIIMALPSLWT